MTQKEKLITELFKLKSQYYKNEGKENPWRDTPNDEVFYRMSRDYKVWELEQQVKDAEKSLQQQRIRMDREAYWQTEAGAKQKKQLEEALEVLRSKHNEIELYLHNSVETLAKEWLGDDFVCSRASVGYRRLNVEIAVENKEEPGQALFGHVFDLSYGRGFLREDEMKLEMNYGTLGSFDLQQDENRITFLQGMAKLASNNYLKNALIDLFNDCIKKQDACSREYNQIKGLLDNPLAQN